MFCTRCGTKLPDGVKFCTSCGNDLRELLAANVGKAAEEAAAPIEEAAAAVQEAAPIEEAAQEIAAPIEEAVEEAAAPVEEAVEEAAAPIEEAVEEAAAPVEEAADDLPEEVGFAAGAAFVGQYPQPAPEYYPDTGRNQQYQQPPVPPQQPPVPPQQPPTFRENPPEVVAPAEPEKKKKGKGLLVGLIVAAVLAAALAGLNVWQYMSNKKAVKEKDESITALQGEKDSLSADLSAKQADAQRLNDELSQTKSELQQTQEQLANASSSAADEKSALEDRIEDLEGQLAEMEAALEESGASAEELAAFYEDVVDLFYTYDRPFDPAYASENFYADGPICVLSMSDTEGREMLVTSNPGQAHSLNYEVDDGSIADVVPDSDTFETAISLTVVPKAVGHTLVTFTNDVNDEVVQVLIVVTE